VIEELQRGYHLEGRVLRHAMVKVSMGPGPQQSAGSETSSTDGEVATDGEGSGDANS
jgi:molecular chaperone GrpE